MTVTVYRSSDSGAPALRGYTPGDLINLLNKCLVAGYGSQSPAGWTMPFTGTNLAAFKQGSGSNGMYLRVDDTDATASSARAARVVGYEAMSDVNTGTPASFPTALQQSGGLKCFTYGGATAANARQWVLVATAKAFYLTWSTVDTTLLTETSVSNSAAFQQLWFGDLAGASAADLFDTYIVATKATETSPVSNVPRFYPPDSTSVLYLARQFSGTGGSVQGSTQPLSIFCPVSAWGSGTMLYPNPADGGLYMSQISVQDGTRNAIRGLLPGLWAPCHTMSSVGAPMTQVPGSGALAGKNFEIRGGSSGCSAFQEISDTW